ncbi:MAG: nucleotide pyrophosphatase/phosphodiesterase family protein [Leptolyngbyaceae bacterium]|nr:nucleotide pyrophosphatase/phosphodiesterase family protein [Leptolyngbyaceae bacterium]
MLNVHSIEAIAAARINENLGRPLYDSYCFSQIPGAIAHCLTGQGSLGLPDSVLTDLPRRYEKVVLLFIDGLGWRFFDQYVDAFPFLRRFLQQGVVSKLTSQFPSTTAVHATTIHTGLSVGQSGIVEWHYYEPKLGRVIAPLPFSYAGDHERETLMQAGIDPATIFPGRTLYHQLEAVAAYCFQHQTYAHSSFSTTVCDGATIVPYRTLPEAIATLLQLLAQPGKGYYLLYIDSVDGVSHRYGPRSAQLEAEIQGVCLLLETLLYQGMAQFPDTLLLVTADHGHLEVSPENTIYLTERCPKLAQWIERDCQGELRVPCGGPRDFFLHVRTETLDEAETYLTEKLGDFATVYRSQWLVEQGYFGPVADQLRDRLSPLILLPHKHVMVDWQPPKDSKKPYFGHHGGLTAEELEIPLLATVT